MEEQNPEIKPRRYVFLYILCILSYLANLVLIFINIILLSGSKIVEWMLKIPVLDIITEEELHGNYIYFLIKIDLHVFCIFAVSLLLLRKRVGFFYYLAVQIILLLIPFFFLGVLNFLIS